jgi:hypothetical protein
MSTLREKTDNPYARAALFVLLIVALIAVLLSLPSWLNKRSAPAPSVVITFTPPTQFTDGTAIAAGTPISYDIYQGVNGGAKVKIGTVTQTPATINTGLEPGNEYCYHAIAKIANADPSEPSNQDCKLITSVAPQPVVITVN